MASKDYWIDPDELSQLGQELAKENTGFEIEDLDIKALESYSLSQQLTNTEESISHESDIDILKIGSQLAEIKRRAQKSGIITTKTENNELDEHSDICIKVSLERLSWQSKERKLDWKKGAGWIEELVEGLLSTLANVGKINLDLMDFRTIVGHSGQATILVGSGTTSSLTDVVKTALKSPLSDLNVEGAKGCWIQVEGGQDMTIYQLNTVAEEFISLLDSDCQVLLGARSSDEMLGRIRIVAVVSGL